MRAVLELPPRPARTRVIPANPERLVLAAWISSVEIPWSALLLWQWVVAVAGHSLTSHAARWSMPWA